MRLPNSSIRKFVNRQSPWLIRPVGHLVVPAARDLADPGAVTGNGEDVRVAAACRGKREVPSGFRVGGALVAAFAKRQLACGAGGQVVDLDVVSAGGARAVGDLVI